MEIVLAPMQTLDEMIAANPDPNAFDFSSVRDTPEEVALAQTNAPIDFDTMLGDYIAVGGNTGLYVKPLMMGELKAILRFAKMGPEFQALLEADPLAGLEQITALMQQMLVMPDPDRAHPEHEEGYRPATAAEIDRKLRPKDIMRLLNEFTGLAAKGGDSKN